MIKFNFFSVIKFVRMAQLKSALKERKKNDEFYDKEICRLGEENRSALDAMEKHMKAKIIEARKEERAQAGRMISEKNKVIKDLEEKVKDGQDAYKMYRAQEQYFAGLIFDFAVDARSAMLRQNEAFQTISKYTEKLEAYTRHMEKIDDKVKRKLCLNESI